MYLSTTRTLPVRSKRIAWAQLVEMTGVHPSRMAEIIEIGWIEPVRTGGSDYLFSLEDVYRIKKLNRLCADLGISTLGGSIIVDLLARIEELETQVKELRKLI